MKRKLALMCAIMLSAGLMFGCSSTKKDDTSNKTAQTQEQQKPEEKTSETAKQEMSNEQVSLDGWAGTWNSIVAWFDNEEVKKSLGDTADADIAAKNKGTHTDFKSMIVDGNTITFLDSAKDGKELAKSEYKFVEKKVNGEGEHSEWDIFEATSDLKDPKYKFIALMPVHGEEGDLTHFHVRYGSTVDEALADNTWWPVIASPETTVEQVVSEIKTVD